MDIFRRILGRNNENVSTEAIVLQTHDSEEELDTARDSEQTMESEPVSDSSELHTPEGDTSPLEKTEPDPILVQTEQLSDHGATVIDNATRPLDPNTLMPIQDKHVSFGQLSDIGMVRGNNQDATFSFFSTSRSVGEHPDFGLFVVADGMGGHHDGEKASETTIRTVAKHVIEGIYLSFLSLAVHDADRPTITEVLIAAAKKANTEVIDKVPDGGTTLSAVAILRDWAHIVHVGDSRIYFVLDGSIEQVTRDHSLVQRLIELGQLSEDEAENHPQKNVLYRAIGQNPLIEVDTLTRRLQPNTKVLLCSDGLWGLVEDDELAEIVEAYPDPQEACTHLIQLANSRGGTDNITAIIIRSPEK